MIMPKGQQLLLPGNPNGGSGGEQCEFVPAGQRETSS